MLMNSENRHPFADAVRRIAKHRGVNILIVGKTQTRKSTIAMVLAHILNPERFKLEEHCIVIDGDKFLELLGMLYLKRGDVCVADDFGIAADHRSWHSRLNKGLNRNMQTRGFKGLIVIVTVPFETYIDSDLRKLFDLQITTFQPDEDRKIAYCKIEEIRHIEVKNEVRTYKIFPRMRYPDGKITMVDKFAFSYGGEKMGAILKRYFAIATPAKNALNKKTVSERKEEETERNLRHLDVDACVEKIKADLPRFLKMWQGRRLIDTHILRNEFNVGFNGAKKIQSRAHDLLKEEIEHADIQA